MGTGVQEVPSSAGSRPGSGRAAGAAWPVSHRHGAVERGGGHAAPPPVVPRAGLGLGTWLPAGAVQSVRVRFAVPSGKEPDRPTPLVGEVGRPTLVS